MQLRNCRYTLPTFALSSSISHVPSLSSELTRFTSILVRVSRFAMYQILRLNLVIANRPRDPPASQSRFRQFCFLHFLETRQSDNRRPGPQERESSPASCLSPVASPSRFTWRLGRDGPQIFEEGTPRGSPPSTRNDHPRSCPLPAASRLSLPIYRSHSLQFQCLWIRHSGLNRRGLPSSCSRVQQSISRFRNDRDDTGAGLSHSAAQSNQLTLDLPPP